MEKDAPLPWTAILTILGIAFAVYALGLIYSIERIAQARRQALDLQQARIQQIALRFETDLALQAQVTQVAAVTVADDPRSDAVERTLRRLLAATDPSALSAIGVYYSGGAEPIRVERGTARANDGDYAHSAWYKAAIAAPGKPVFTDAGATSTSSAFISASETFGSPLSPQGVVVVQAPKPALDSMQSRSRASSDHVWITNQIGAAFDGTLPSATMTIDNTVSTPLTMAPWTLYVASHFPEVDRAQSDAFQIAIPLTIVAWGGALLTIFGMLRVRKLQLRAAALQKTVMRDTLTGLYNRAYVLWRLKESLRTFALNRKSSFGVLYIDLDRFAVVNDSLGHSVGDELLCAIANRLETGLPKGVDIGRVGGDEFVAYIPPNSDPTTCESVAELIFGHLRQSFKLGDREVYISASIGIVEATGHYGRADELLRDADLAMYAAKRAGRNRLAVFDESMREQVQARQSMESALHRAISLKQIFARYQPIVDLQTGEVSGVEALARWMDDHGKLIAPDQFIPLAEQCGAIDAIDWTVLGQACADVRALHAIAPQLTVSVNLSATRLSQTDLADRIHEMLESTGLHPSAVKFEVTESAIMENPDDSLHVLNDLCKRGSLVVIDDFGTGHSSLSYVQRLPVAGLKIDRSFITPIARDNQSLAIVQAIIALAKTLNIYVVAEGVEEAAQVEKLRASGVDFGQGYYFSPALEPRGLEAFIESRKDVVA